MGERKLVDAFKTFFDRTVSPHLSQNQEVMREWNHLSKILSSEPIDYSQIEFYLLLSNKNSGAGKSQGNIPSYGKIPEEGNSNKFRHSDFNAMMRNNVSSNMEKKNSILPPGVKRRNLIANLEGFQKMLTQNQEKLEGLTRNGTTGLNTSANGLSMRRY